MFRKIIVVFIIIFIIFFIVSLLLKETEARIEIAEREIFDDYADPYLDEWMWCNKKRLTLNSLYVMIYSDKEKEDQIWQ